MPITPDTKDWTWVLQRRCPQCGFEATAVGLADLPGLILANAAGWSPVLHRSDVAQRPDDATWSPLEYAAHVRDVYRLFGQRLHQMLAQDDPLFPNWDQDAAAVAARYDLLDPLAVLPQIEQAAGDLAAAFAAIDPGDRDRTGRRSDGARFTVLTLGRYGIHDPIHHLWDVSHGR